MCSLFTCTFLFHSLDLKHFDSYVELRKSTFVNTLALAIILPSKRHIKYYHIYFNEIFSHVYTYTHTLSCYKHFLIITGSKRTEH
jgi:hypothetical protein